MLEKIAENLWVAGAPQKYLGMPIGTRMTVVKLGDGGLFLHSPVPLTPEVQQGLSELGEPCAIVSPNRYHHLHVGAYFEAYPKARIYAAPGLPEKRKDLVFHGVLGEDPEKEWEGEIEQTILQGIPILNEVVFFHIGSKTLLVTDLFFNYPTTGSLLERLYRKLEGCDGKFAVARLIKLVARNKKALKESCDRILQWDFDRIIVTHGEVLESGGKEAFRIAVQWL